MSTPASVRVNKLDIECLLSPELASTQAIAGRFTAIAGQYLSRVLEDVLRPMDEGGDEVIFIKNLQLDFDVDLLLSQEEITRVWADKIKHTLLKAISPGATSTKLVFASPEVYLSRALLEIARGRAMDLWYFQEFNGLWALPLHLALRTALLDDPARSRAALKQLSDSELGELCSKLSRTEVERVLAGLFAVPDIATLSAERVVAFVQGVGGNYQQSWCFQDQPEHQTLLLACLALKHSIGLEQEVISRCAKYFVVLMRLQYRYPEKSRDFLKALGHGHLRGRGLGDKSLGGKELSQLKSWLTGEELADLAPLLDLSSSVLQPMVQTLVPKDPCPTQGSANDELGSTFTYFGNALLLLPQINSLPLTVLEEAHGPWKPLKKQSARSILSWLILCVCQSKNKFYSAFHDPLLRDLNGIAPGLSLEEVSEWLNEQLKAFTFAELFSVLKDGLLATVSSSTNKSGLQCFHWLEKNNPKNYLIKITRESNKGGWLNLATLEKDSEWKFEGEQCTGEQSLVMEDFRSLWLSEATPFDHLSKSLLTVLAQHTLKSFAYRVPGFTNSSVNYLLQNFLSMSATLVVDGESINAFLSRVPMSVMLNMAGLNRGVLELPEFNRRRIRLSESA